MNKPIYDQKLLMKKLLLTRNELADLLVLSVRTVARMERRGEIPFIKLGTRTVRFNRKAVLKKLGLA